MVPVLNCPFLEHFIAYLKKHNITEVIIALGQQVNQIQSYFGSGDDFGVKISYSMEDFPLGTAGAVKNAERFLDSSFIVFNGDVFTEIDLTAMMNLHHKNKANANIALTPVDNPTIYGVVQTDTEGRVKRFVEKPSWDEVTTNMINAGIYIMEPSILDYITPNVFSMFERDVFPLLLKEGQAIYSYPSEAYWIDIGTPEKYLKLHHDLLHRYPADEGIKFEGESFVHPSAQIERPVIIGKGCFVDKDCIIRGPAVLGPKCQIEEGAIIEGAVLWQNCIVSKEARLRNCVLASNCCIEGKSEVLDNCVLGDNARIGESNKLSQGIKIWPNKSIEPNAISF
jgi:mannose-1-phosphate guanylyltransferase